MEISQYFIGRYADPVDLITNTFGSILGFWLGVYAIKYFGLRPSAILGINPDDQTSTKVNTVASLRFLYIAVYLLSSFLPFDLVFDPSHIYAKLHPDKYGQIRLILDPFYHFLRWNHDSEAVTGLFLGLLPVGILTAILHGFRKKLKPAAPMFVCFLLALACETGQVFIFSRTSDILMLPLAIAAGILGWLIALVWFMLQDWEGYSFFENVDHRNKFLLFIMIGYFLLLISSALSPYHFEYSLKAIEQKLIYQTNFIPLRNQLDMHNIDASFELVRNVGAFVPLGLLLTFWLRIHRFDLKRSWIIAIVALLCALGALLLEFFRAMGVGYYFDMTTVLLGCGGGLIGSIFFRFLTK
jgi:glycopeptide antibiotics resistance protein